MNSSWLHLELKIRGPNFHFLIRDTVTRRAHVTLAPNFIFKELGKRKFNVFIIYLYGEHDFLDSFSYMHSVFPYKAVWSDPRRLVVSSIPAILIVIYWKKSSFYQPFHQTGSLNNMEKMFLMFFLTVAFVTLANCLPTREGMLLIEKAMSWQIVYPR